MKISELQEAIKGWKHAGRDIAAMRAARVTAGHTAKLVRLKKDGTESKMHDASSTYPSEEAARAKHAAWLHMNPGRDIRHNLYVDGKLVGVLDSNLKENATSGGTSSGSIASVPMHQGKVIRQPNLFGYVPVRRKTRTKAA